MLAGAELPAAETAFYRVTLDYGAGPVDLGIYTGIEVVDDTVDRVFGGDSGNIYEGDGSAATFAAGTLEQIKNSFQKENNKQAADWSDVEKLYGVLHSAERTSDATAWRAKQESAFEVDGFLKWLVLAATLQHWDSYGAMAHNYYLYNNPANDKLTWISWDHNLVLGASPFPGGGGLPDAAGCAFPGGAAKPDGFAASPEEFAPMGGAGGLPGMGMGSVTFDKAEIGASWPLIRFLLDDPTYNARYVGFLKDIGGSLFLPDRLAAQVQKLAALVGPYAAKDGGQSQYGAAVQSLNATIKGRAQALAEFVAAH